MLHACNTAGSSRGCSPRTQQTSTFKGCNSGAARGGVRSRVAEVIPDVVTSSAPTTTGVKLPSSHVQASKRALEQLKESATNRWG